MAAFRTLTTAVATVLAFFAAAPAVVAQTASDFSPQQMLETLAKPLPAGSRMGLPASFPAFYQGWTEAQKQTGAQMVSQRCGLMYALEGDNPKAHLLPETMTKREAAELAMSVCLSSKMPADWPGRQKSIDDAQRLIEKANSQGATLHLPKALQGTR